MTSQLQPTWVVVADKVAAEPNSEDRSSARSAFAYVLWRTWTPECGSDRVPTELIVTCLLPAVLVDTWRARLATYAAGLLPAPVIVLALLAFMGVIPRVYPGV